MFDHTIAMRRLRNQSITGAGLWTVIRAASGSALVEVVTAAPPPPKDRDAAHAAAARYAACVGVPVSVAFR